MAKNETFDILSSTLHTYTAKNTEENKDLRKK